MQLSHNYNNIVWEVIKLDEDDVVKSFDCGDLDLNDFILRESPLYRKEKLAVTYVMRMPNDIANEHIAAFFSLSNDRISVSDFDNKTKYNRFSRRFNNRKRLKSYPAVKIGRLGVDITMKGQGMGGRVLNFIKHYFTADNKTGCRFITVDAYTAAIPFYLRNGFVPLNDDDSSDPTRVLYFDLSDLDED